MNNTQYSMNTVRMYTRMYSDFLALQGDWKLELRNVRTRIMLAGLLYWMNKRRAYK